jgi:hypothetical protein
MTMRRIYVREREYEVIDSMGEWPPNGEPPIMLPPLPEEEQPRKPRAAFWWIVALIVLLLVTFGPKIEVTKAHAQQGMCNFYGVCGGGSYGPNPSVNVYPQNTIIVVPQQSQPEPPLVRDRESGVPLACNWEPRGCPGSPSRGVVVLDY